MQCSITLYQIWEIIKVICQFAGAWLIICIIVAVVARKIDLIAFKRYQKKSLKKTLDYARNLGDKGASKKSNTIEKPKLFIDGTYQEIGLN